MSWRSIGSGVSAWRQCLAPLRQEAAAKGLVARQSLQSALESLRTAAVEVQDSELAEDLSFLIQQLLGPQPTHGAPSSGSSSRDTAPHLALCRLLTSLTASRTLNLHGPAANLILSALRQWLDGAQDGAATPTSNVRPQSSSTISVTSNTMTSGSSTPTSANGAAVGGSSSSSSTAAAADGAAPAGPSSAASLPLEAMTALAALLPDHLGLLSEHERAAQLAALLSLLVPQQSQPRGAAEGARAHRTADVVEVQVHALAALAACCGRGAGGAAGGGAGSGLTADEAGALLSAAVSLLQSCASRSRPVEDSAHSRLYAALSRALQAAIGETRQAWVPRAAMLVEGLQRFLTYGVQASLAAAATAAAACGQQQPHSSPAPAPADGAGGGRYRPPHLRRRESQTDGGGGGLAWSDSDMSDTEHAAGGGGGGGSAGAGSGAVVDRFRSSRVRLAALSCIQAMAKSDPRAMHVHWSALLPLQGPLQPRPLTPHLITVLLYDPLIKVRLLAAATISSLLDGPAQRSILAVAEAKSMSARAPVRGFLTLSLSLGQLLLAAHSGLLHAVATEPSSLVLPGLLRALVVLMAASPYERLPPELLPETLKVLRTRWAALTSSASSSSSAPHATATAAGELAPIQAAFLACLAECFSTKHPIPGLAAFLQQQQQQHLQNPGEPTEQRGGGGGGGGGVSTEQLVRDLLAVGRDASAAAVLRIEALAALKGLAAHYTVALPPDVWEDLRATSAVGLSCSPSPRSPNASRSREGPPSRSSSSSSLGGGGAGAVTHGSSGRLGDRAGPRGSAAPWGSPGPEPGSAGASAAQAAAATAGGPASSSSSSSPEDKAAQLSVKLLSEYLSATARQFGISRTEPGGGGSGDGMDGALPGPPPSPGFVPLAAAVPRQQLLLLQQAGLSPVSVRSEEEREVGVQRLAAMWQDAVAVLVPAATSHTAYMVRSASLACLGEVSELVFSGLPPRLQQQLLTLLSDAAASDAVPAVRAAACKALGAAAAFPAVMAQPGLSDQVTRALLPCLRDAVLSARIAAGWAVANLCDAYRRRLEAGGAAAAADTDPDANDVEQRLRAQRTESHAQASTSTSARSPTKRGGGDSGSAAGTTASASAAPPPPLEPHHYRQLAALCGAAITATQDADKVRANGIRAVGYLLAALRPDMAPGLAAVSAGGAAAAEAGACSGSGSSGAPWRAPRRDAPSAGASGHGTKYNNCNYHNAGAGATVTSATAYGAANARAGSVSAGGWGEGLQLDSWLDGALMCLQSTLTTGGMKVQWNACCAAHGLMRNRALLAHPRAAARIAPLLLLLVMLVRESANFKIRTHAAAALAALPIREAYGDVLPEALLVTAGALESVSSGGGGGAAAGAKPAGAGAGAEQAQAGGGGEGDADGDGDGGEGRFPNYRYTVCLSAQLRATLLHLLSLVQPSDARRVREALARRAEFLHTCLREQLAEAAQPLRAAAAAAARGGGRAAAAAAIDGWGAGAGASYAAPDVDLPADPFGLAAGRGASPGGAGTAGGLAGLLAGLSLAADDGRPSSSGGPGAFSRASRDAPPGIGSGTGGGAVWDGTLGGGTGGGGRPRLTVRVSGGVLDEDVHDLQRARGRVAALAAPLRGFADLLAQLGPSCEPVLRDVRQALAQLQPPPLAPDGSASAP